MKHALVTIARTHYEHAIAVLIGKLPAQFNLPPSPQVRLNLPIIPVGVPSTPLERRPTSQPANAAWRKPMTRSALP
jgi:outer membrane protein TolC